MALYPEPRSALIPLCHLAQEQDGWLRARGHGGDRRADRGHPGRGPRHGHLLRHAPHRAGRHATWCRSAPTSPACWAGRWSCSSTPRSTSACGPGGTTADGVVTLEEAECLADCDRVALRAGQPPLRRAARPPETLRPAGRRPAGRPPGRRRSRPTGRWCGCGATAGLRADRGAGGGRAGGRGRAAGGAAAAEQEGGADGRHRGPAHRHRPHRTTTTRTPSSATWPPAATRACARRSP